MQERVMRFSCCAKREENQQEAGEGTSGFDERIRVHVRHLSRMNSNGLDLYRRG